MHCNGSVFIFKNNHEKSDQRWQLTCTSATWQKFLIALTASEANVVGNDALIPMECVLKGMAFY